MIVLEPFFCAMFKFAVNNAESDVTLCASNGGNRHLYQLSATSNIIDGKLRQRTEKRFSL